MIKKVLVIGSRGMLGSEVVKQLKKNTKLKFVSSDVANKKGIDITDSDSIAKHLAALKPDWVINCAAYTDVNACETEQGYEIAEKVNGLGPFLVLKECKKRNINFIHISTDYVFGDDKKEGYKENYTNFKPLNRYAESKVLSEKYIVEVMGGLEKSDFKKQKPKVYIVRTSWLFGKGAKNFLPRIIELAKEKEYLEVVTDEVSSPTYVKDLAQGLIKIVEDKPRGGIYHISGKGSCSRYEFAKEILKAAGIETEVRPSSQKQFNRPIKVAEYSYLLNTKLPPFRKWQEMVKDYIKNELLK